MNRIRTRLMVLLRVITITLGCRFIQNKIVDLNPKQKTIMHENSIIK